MRLRIERENELVYSQKTEDHARRVQQGAVWLELPPTTFREHLDAVLSRTTQGGGAPARSGRITTSYRRAHTSIWILASALLASVAVLSAADPFTGTWTLNVAKSRFGCRVRPQEQIAVISEKGNQLYHEVTTQGIDGSRIRTAFQVPVIGGKGTVIESKSYDQVVMNRLTSNERVISYGSAGKVVNIVHSRITADRRVMYLHFHKIDASGCKEKGNVVLERQP